MGGKKGICRDGRGVGDGCVKEKEKEICILIVGTGYVS